MRGYLRRSVRSRSVPPVRPRDADFAEDVERRLGQRLQKTILAENFVCLRGTLAFA